MRLSFICLSAARLPLAPDVARALEMDRYGQVGTFLLPSFRPPSHFERLAYTPIGVGSTQLAHIQDTLVHPPTHADPAALAQLMADHTSLDWRPLLPRITIPCLNLVGRQSAVFPW